MAHSCIQGVGGVRATRIGCSMSIGVTIAEGDGRSALYPKGVRCAAAISATRSREVLESKQYLGGIIQISKF